jgi:uncharacterized phage protein (TIGR01671 family)
MRNIKFRAFVDGEMYPVTNLDYIQDGSGIIAHVHVKGINQEIPSGQFELMQYTGLKDKNGVEIYEGDVVEIYLTEPAATSRPNIGKVFWNEEDLCFSLEVEISTGVVEWGFGFTGLKVLGNIFEGFKNE